MKYVDFKVNIFALICLKYVADGQNGRFTNGSGYFNSSSSAFDLRLNFTLNSMPAFNKTYSNCISILRMLKPLSYEINVVCDECTQPCLPLSNTGTRCSIWSTWSNCSVTCGSGTRTRVRVCTGPNCTVKDEFETIKCNTTQVCQEPSFWSAWSAWSNCSVTCGNGTQARVKICTGTNCTDKEQFDVTTCNATPECQEPPFWSAWSAWSNCSVTCGNGAQIRVKICTGTNCIVKEQFNVTTCNATPECQEKSTQTNRQEDVTDDAQNFTSAHIAIAATACFLIGILVAALVSIFYMKRKHQGCFFHNNKSVEVGSRMQSGLDLQSLNTRAIANENDSTDNKNENETVETSYESLDLDQISKDQKKQMTTLSRSLLLSTVITNLLLVTNS